MRKMYIGVNIDWSKSFVDTNGAFYCGTTNEQKNLAARLMPSMDLVVYTTDFHSIASAEFKKNNGLWPLHNVAEYQSINVEDLGLNSGTTISPEQTEIIDRQINKSFSGIVVPKHVYFQGGKLLFLPSLVEQALDHRIITPEEFMHRNFTYIISPKVHFDASTTLSERLIPESNVLGIPQHEYTIFDLIQEKFGKDFEIVYVGTGVVDNICRHYTTTGLKQKYPVRVVNIIGATTELFGVGLGFDERNQTRLACERIQKDIGIEHMTLDEMISEIGGSKYVTN
jgi:hypothetical protein